MVCECQVAMKGQSQGARGRSSTSFPLLFLLLQPLILLPGVALLCPKPAVSLVPPRVT